MIGTSFTQSLPHGKQQQQQQPMRMIGQARNHSASEIRTMMDSLHQLERFSNIIFDTISQRIENQTRRLSKAQERTQLNRQMVNKIGKDLTHQSIAIFSPSSYPIEPKYKHMSGSFFQKREPLFKKVHEFPVSSRSQIQSLRCSSPDEKLSQQKSNDKLDQYKRRLCRSISDSIPFEIKMRRILQQRKSNPSCKFTMNSLEKKPALPAVLPSMIEGAKNEAIYQYDEFEGLQIDSFISMMSHRGDLSRNEFKHTRRMIDFQVMSLPENLNLPNIATINSPGDFSTNLQYEKQEKESKFDEGDDVISKSQHDKQEMKVHQQYSHQNENNLIQHMDITVIQEKNDQNDDICHIDEVEKKEKPHETIRESNIDKEMMEKQFEVQNLHDLITSFDKTKLRHIHNESDSITGDTEMNMRDNPRDFTDGNHVKVTKEGVNTKEEKDSKTEESNGSSHYQADDSFQRKIQEIYIACHDEEESDSETLSTFSE